MPDIIPATGLHMPITNLVASESSVNELRESAGSVGYGNVWPIDNDAQTERLPQVVLESALESTISFNIPDLSGLADVGTASFGERALLETVIGTDERIRINDTEKFPWRITASLLITAADNSQWIGTGWFISPRTLITAGHVVYIKNSGIAKRDGWVKKIQVMPGRNANQLPYGGITSTEFWSVKGWGDSGAEPYDYGAIILPAAFEQDLGAMWFGVYSDNQLLNSIANVHGYPGDKPSGTMWYDNRKIGSVTPEKVYYAADTYGGQSGAPVYIVESGVRKAIAIHTYGGTTANSGTRISTQVYANLEAWKRT